MDHDCIFCRIIADELPATFVYRDEGLVAIRDINPQAPTHLLLIPREHIARILDLKPEQAGILARMVETANRLARERGLENGFRLVVNNGPEAGQSVDHLHIHLLGGRAMQWPPG